MGRTNHDFCSRTVRYAVLSVCIDNGIYSPTRYLTQAHPDAGYG